MTRQSHVDTLVTVFGGSGFLGRHVVRALCREGYRLRVAVRRPDLANHLQPLGRVGQIHAVQANLRYPASIEAAAHGAEIVINLVGILFERGKQSFGPVQAEGPGHIARIASAQGARMIHVSAIGADKNSPSVYAQTKAAGEEAVFSAARDAVVFRPSILFGPEDDFFNRFASMARFSPVLPLIGGGETRFQPVFAGDVAQAIAKATRGEAKAGAIYELGGPEIKTFKELMQYVLVTIERKRFLVPIPFGLAEFQAMVLELLPKPLLTRDQVRLLKVDNVVSDAAASERHTFEGLGIDPVAISSIVPTYLWRFRKSGQFRSRLA